VRGGPVTVDNSPLGSYSLIEVVYLSTFSSYSLIVVVVVGGGAMVKGLMLVVRCGSSVGVDGPKVVLVVIVGLRDVSELWQQSSVLSKLSKVEVSQLSVMQTRPPRQSLSLSQSPCPSPHWLSGVQQLSPPRQVSSMGVTVEVVVAGADVAFSSQQSIVALLLVRLSTKFLQLLFPQK